MSSATVASIVLFAALILVLVLAPAASAVLARFAKPGQRAKHARYARSMLILWAMTWLAIYALRLWGQTPADVGWRAPTEPAAAYLVVLAFIGLLAAAALRAQRAGDPMYSDRIRLIAPLTPADWFWYVPVALTAGICEEFLYRGYALHVVADLTHNLWIGVIVSTAAFGLAHAYQGARGVIGTTIFGLFFALVIAVWGSLWPCMIGHALQDLIGGWLVYRRLGAHVEQPPGDAPQTAAAADVLPPN